MSIVLCGLWIFAAFAIGCSLFGQCIDDRVIIFSVGCLANPGQCQMVPRCPLGAPWCPLVSFGVALIHASASPVSLTRRFGHIKEQRLLDKAADWNVLARNLKLDKGRSAKGGIQESNSSCQTHLPGYPVLAFQKRLEDVNWNCHANTS